MYATKHVRQGALVTECASSALGAYGKSANFNATSKYHKLLFSKNLMVHGGAVEPPTRGIVRVLCKPDGLFWLRCLTVFLWAFISAGCTAGHPLVRPRADFRSHCFDPCRTTGSACGWLEPVRTRAHTCEYGSSEGREAGRTAPANGNRWSRQVTGRDITGTRRRTYLPALVAASRRPASQRSRRRAPMRKGFKQELHCHDKQKRQESRQAGLTPR